MTKELEPCPFCNGQLSVNQDEDGWWYHSCTEYCYLSAGFPTKEEAIIAANTRYKRTCHMENDGLDADPDGLVGYTCTRCGFGMSYPYDSKPTGFCAGCGAEVVDDD